MRTSRATRACLAAAALYAAALATAAPASWDAERWMGSAAAALAVVAAGLLLLVWRAVGRTGRGLLTAVAVGALAASMVGAASFGLLLAPWALAVALARVFVLDAPAAAPRPAFDPRAPERA